VPLKPMPAPRPRVTRSGIAYMPAAYKAWKRDFVRCVPYQLKTQYEGAVSVFIDCMTSVPKSYSKREREAALRGQAWPVGDPDNLAKGVLDAMTEAGVWKDDRQVVLLTVRKRYADLDRIQVRVERDASLGVDRAG